MESKQTRKNPITTISVSQNIITELDEYLINSGMSRKEFVEKAIKYFIRTGFDLNSNISELTPLQNAVQDLKELHEKEETKNNAIMLLLQNIYKAQKALPTKEDIKKEDRYNKAKKALLKLLENKKSVRVGKIRQIVNNYFDL